jgi:DNA/RNA endonuclease G (NUC1)
MLVSRSLRAKTAPLSRQIFSLAISTFLLLQHLLIISPTTAKAAAASNLFFSEYIEGSSNNKALEIYNGTGSSINLSAGNYTIQMYFNGSATSGLTIPLTGTVPNNDVFVLAHSAANAAILAQADQTNGSGWYNGDDAVALLKGGVVLDVIGQIGSDPGTEWGTGLTSTADNTIRRKSSISAGDTTPNDSFDPSSQWDGFANDTVNGLGSHTFTGGGNQAPIIAAPTNPIATVTQDAAPFTVTLNGSDDNSVYSWAATAGSGIASVNVTAGQGTSSVTYTVALQSGFTGTATFTASLSDNVNSSVSRSVNIQVNPNVTNFAPSITAPANPITTVAQDAQPFTVSLNGSDDNNIYNWSGTIGAGVSSVSVTSGQGTFNPTYTVTLQSGFSGTANFTASLTDNFNAPVTQTVNIAVTPAPPPPLDHIVISQVYGGGGNSGAAYQNDFVELFNPDTVSHDLSGWTIQYASDTGASWQVQPLGGTMAPGEYYLIKLATNGAIGAVVPEANINGNLNLSGANGKVALVRNGDALNGCVIGDPVVDLVGYGSSANCREGVSNAPSPSATNSIFRKNGGFTDTNVNGADFATGAPNPNRRTTPIVELPPTTLSSDPRKNSTNAPRDASITVTFTEPVDIADGWFSISCVTTGSHNSATVVPGGANGWIIIPNVNFQPGEQCSITVNKEFVHDSDLDDSLPNTDQLTSSYTATFTVATGAAPAYPADVHLTFGNPSGAATDTSMPNNYLMIKPEYSLSYNKDRGIPNWVSWHLADEWIGSLDRIDTFRADPAVPADWYRVTHLDYTGSGFDRGHMVPNADRDPETSTPINQATFLMSNMIPQAPDNNQGPWANLENYLRTLLPANEIYIVAGGAGTGGTGSNGSKTTIANGKVTVPARTWKVALVIPKQNGDDVSRVNASARTIAVNMPNIQGIRTTNPNDWQQYLVSIDQVEALTGYDFFSNLPDAVENSIEAGINGANPPGTESFSVSTVEDTSKSITLNAVSANNNPLTFTIVNAAAHGTLTGTGADRVYTPASDFVGTDSFTFRASDGSNNSNISTVTITVTEYNENPTANNDAKSAQEDTQLIFSAADLLVNDNAGDSNEVGQTLNVTNVAVTANTHGTVTFSAGQITYTPDANYNGSTDFNYQVCDNGTTNGVADAKCATGVVNVTIDPVNDNPVANPDSAVTDEDTAITIDVLGNDTDIDADNISIESVGNAAKGILVVTGGKVLYTPNQNANGADSFSYTVNDGHGGASAGAVNIVINAVNDAPTAIADSAATNEDTPVTIDVRGNDSDVDGDQLSITNVTAPAKGTAAITADGKILYTPNPNQNGADSFTYAISDGKGGTATAAVSVSINPVNDAPTLAPISNKTVVLGNTLSFTAVASDIDLPTQTLTFGFVGEVPAGATINSATGAFSWTPTQAQAGKIYTFTIRVTDSGNLSSEQSFTVAVAYEWSNFLQPINSTGDNSFNAGSTIPVKFKLTGASQGIANATAKLWLAKVVNNVPGAEFPAESSGNSNTGNLFRHDGNGQYSFNLSTKDLSTGTYQLRVDLADGVLRTVLITLR